MSRRSRLPVSASHSKRTSPSLSCGPSGSGRVRNITPLLAVSSHAVSHELSAASPFDRDQWVSWEVEGGVASGPRGVQRFSNAGLEKSMGLGAAVAKLVGTVKRMSLGTVIGSKLMVCNSKLSQYCVG